MRLILIALAAAWHLAAIPPASAGDPFEPRVLLGSEAAILAAGLAAAESAEGSGEPALDADVAVVLLEPAGLVRVVLIDTEGRRKAWVVTPIETFAEILRNLGEKA